MRPGPRALVDLQPAQAGLGVGERLLAVVERPRALGAARATRGVEPQGAQAAREVQAAQGPQALGEPRQPSPSSG